MCRSLTGLWWARGSCAAALMCASACDAPDAAGRWALVALKVVAGLVVVMLVFLPLMASLATIRAGIRRLLGARGGDRKRG